MEKKHPLQLMFKTTGATNGATGMLFSIEQLILSRRFDKVYFGIIFLLYSFTVAHVSSVGIASQNIPLPGENVYPPYCAKNLRPDQRQSPALHPEDAVRNLKLHQVHLIFRHGARTPTSFHYCWDGMENEHWNCEYEELTAGVFLNSSLSENAGQREVQSLRLAKAYDADPGRNVLGGTCQEGQLLVEGAQQHTILGRFMAESYFIEDHPLKLPRMNSSALFQVEKEWSTSLYVRSTDIQRTRMSAANLVSSLYRGVRYPQNQLIGATEKDPETLENTRAPLIVLHTMDIESDYMTPRHMACEALADAGERAARAPEFQKLVRERLKLVETMDRIMGFSLKEKNSGYTALDCLMTHVCTNRWNAMPDMLRPNGSNPEKAMKLIHNAITFVEDQMAYIVIHNDSAVAKLAIADFVRVLGRELKNGVSTESQASGSYKKLYAWSGHDTTLVPLLASLVPKAWDKRWPPYASLFIIEVCGKDVGVIE